jgi:hypothetical protein
MNGNEDNFWEHFPGDNDLSAVPIKFRKFLHRDTPPATFMQTMSYYAHGYKQAFERLVMIALRLWPNAEYLRLPTFFLARHAAELSLKEVIQQCSAANGILDLASDEHKLVKLWELAKRHATQAGYPTDDEWSDYCGKLIQHLDEMDPNGQRFRYPGDNTGQPFDYTRVELQHLARAHAHITLWCEAITDMLHESDQDFYS